MNLLLILPIVYISILAWIVVCYIAFFELVKPNVKK